MKEITNDILNRLKRIGNEMYEDCKNDEGYDLNNAEEQIEELVDLYKKDLLSDEFIWFASMSPEEIEKSGLVMRDNGRFEI